jgi:outer membrane murein-binding lipoprotein Lpp
MKKYFVLAAMMLLIPCMASAKDTWYSTEEKARIDAQFEQMQAQIDELNGLTAKLQTKVNQISQQPAAAPQIQQVVETKVIETKEIVREPDNTRVEALEARVSTLEKAVDYIQNQVMQAINTVISLLKKLV